MQQQNASKVAAARRAALKRQQSILNRANSDKARLQAAEDAIGSDLIRVASMLYIRVATSDVSAENTAVAKEGLATLQEQGREKLQEMIAVIEEADDADVFKLFARFDELAEQYEKVPVVGGEISGQLAKTKGKPQYAALLKEPEAALLVQLAKKDDADGNPCCAFIAYERAAALAPAPSGVYAKEMIKKLSLDPARVADAKRCRTIRQYHRVYDRAERLAKASPKKAHQLFAQVVEKTPAETVLHQSARDRVEDLAN